MAARKTERDAITACEHLGNLAERLNMSGAADFLGQNLGEERAAEEKLASLVREPDVSKGAVTSDSRTVPAQVRSDGPRDGSPARPPGYPDSESNAG